MTILINTPRFITAGLPGNFGAPSVSLRAIHDHVRDIYVTMSVTVEHPMVAITPTLVRKLRLRDTKAHLLRQELATANPALMTVAPLSAFLKGTHGRPVSRKDCEAPTTERLDQAVAVLRLARLTGEFSAVSIERCFGIERTEARRWVILARRHAAAVAAGSSRPLDSTSKHV